MGGVPSKVAGIGDGIEAEGVSITATGIVGNAVAVEKLGTMATGVTVGISPGGDDTEFGIGRFCRIYTIQLPITHRTNTPQPNPPKRNLSNAEMDFRCDSIEVMNSTEINPIMFQFGIHFC